MKEMILCMLVLALIIGAANMFELPSPVNARHPSSGAALSGLCARTDARPSR